jgi:hypothetical protein
MTIIRLAGVLLILVPIAFNVAFALLQKFFDYPEVLRKPTEDVLRRFEQGGRQLVSIWYGFMVSALMFVPVVILVHQVVARDDTPLMPLATTIGVLGGIVQVLGLVRWPFLVPYLAKTFVDPSSSPATRDSVAVVFQTFNRYAGVAIGEHLGYLFTSGWTLLLALTMTQSALFSPWLGWIGIIPAIGVFAGVLEQAGFKAAAVINAVSYILWSLWLLAVGIVLVLS